ncbi:SusC/RagA family TonB-linked outer membrane protein [Elizabethkingia argentiflava]|uniref:SusC/RagA family TonB-linked outer membrane protein n=1 Tax=Elizabethkingia argenteiflava TaxID=2681556 RepID=A0A845PXS3_9FLAO|nr:TonB-dependent receptor [Elizabethkingia argenteiflava]NAW52043.1 SusC/RagA family TonB-linked outer membrane protein [Elizabethkingia argenteiflava]
MFRKSLIAHSIRTPIGIAGVFLGGVGLYAQNIKQNKDSLRQQQIDEVVVVAYGKAKKSSFTGSVSTISGDRIATRPVVNVSKVLEGQVAGVQAVSASGQPGAAAEIRIRGIGSVNSSSEPLYVVDGIPFDGNINAISPNDIESISVLKDATASALYGSRGANGIIIITTKSGKKGDSRVNFNISQGFLNRAVKDYEQVNTNQYFELYWEALRNGYVSSKISSSQAAQMATDNLVSALGINPYGAQYPNPVGVDGKLLPGATPLWNDDWRKVLQRPASRSQVDLDLSGGNGKGNYFFSLGYLDEKGMAIESDFKRYSTRLKVNSKVKDWLDAGANLSYVNSIQNAPTSSDTKSDNVILAARIIPSFYPYYQRNVDGSFVLDKNGNKIYDFGTYRPAGALANENLAATLPLDKNERQIDNFSGKGFLEFTFLPELKFKSSLSIDLVSKNGHDYVNPLLGSGKDIGGEVSKINSRVFSYTTSNILTYDKRLEQHHINVLAGQEFYQYKYQIISGRKSQFSLPGYTEPDAAASISGFDGKSDKLSLYSFLGKLEYDYQNKYFFATSIRKDGSSRFYEKKRWGTFWSVGGSWKLSKESFVQDLGIFDQLTLRASYGAQGNDKLDTYYGYQSLYSFYNNLGEPGVVLSQPATPHVTWETNINLNLGLEFAILKNRIKGNIEYFKRQSKNLLFEMPTAPSIGFSKYNANVGTLQNTGVEISLQTTPILGQDFRWDLDINATTTRNRFKSLPKPSIIKGSQMLTVGGSIYDFYIPTWAGVDAETGAPLWKKITTDSEGKTAESTTSEYAEATRIYQGSSLPKWVGGINTVLTYKNFDISGLLSFRIGGKILDQDYTSLLSSGSATGRAWGKEILNRWTPDNRYTNVPALNTTTNYWTSRSSRFLYSGTYARLKTVSLGYSLPQEVFEKIGLRRLRIYLQGENLLTFYKHKGMDPEQTFNGITYYRYPAMRTVTFGLQATL